MDLTERNEKLIEEIDQAVESVWKTVSDMRQEISRCVQDISQVMQEFLNRTGELEKLGVDIPVEIITSQLSNLQQGIEFGDSILIADTLQYEIKNTVLFYTDILRELEKERGE